MIKKLLLIAQLLFLVGCEKLVNIGDIPSNSKYPAKIGYEWEYNTVWKFEFYDSLGHIDSTSLEDLGNTIVRVTKNNEVLGNQTNLIRFEDFDVATPQNIHRMWYLNADSGFYAIAYHNPGVSQFVIPKQGILTIEQIKSFVKSFRVFPSDANLTQQSYHVTDSIQYYSPARKVLKYPLSIGARWIELIEPFYRERFINKQQIVNANGTNYYCYKVESTLTWAKFIMNDYIDMNYGLIMRELIGDSISISNPGSPDLVGYYKSTTTSKLVREIKIQ